MKQEEKIETTAFPSDAGKTVVEPKESIDDQLKRIQLENALLEKENLLAEKEAKQLEKQEREYHIKELKSSIAARELADKQAKLDRESQGKTFAQADATDKYNWAVCTHRKGGMASSRDIRCLTTGGNDAGQYAVIKHQMINGDIWVRCQRCARTWMPPIEKNFYFRDGVSVAPKDGVFDRVAFDKAVSEYELAKQFPTRNSMSGSVQCRFTTFDLATKKHIDAADIYRERLASTNLR
jgi:hypothetical protein